jgi:hypothetical protein
VTLGEPGDYGKWPENRHIAPGRGATALSNDGSYLHAHHQGVCSRHGGIKGVYK